MWLPPNFSGPPTPDLVEDSTPTWGIGTCGGRDSPDDRSLAQGWGLFWGPSPHPRLDAVDVDARPERTADGAGARIGDQGADQRGHYERGSRGEQRDVSL